MRGSLARTMAQLIRSFAYVGPNRGGTLETVSYRRNVFALWVGHTRSLIIISYQSTIFSPRQKCFQTAKTGFFM